MRPTRTGMANDRVRTKIPAQFKADGLSGRGEVRNVSEGGLFVGTLDIPEEGAAVELRIQAPGKAEVEVSGLVWWTAPVGSKRCGFGLRILGDHDGYRRLLESVR